jgi:serine/threonine-protein kinase RsbW
MQMRVPARAVQVPEARRAAMEFVHTRCRDAGQLALDVGLAVSEACTNVVRHAYPNREGELRLELRVEAAQLIVTIADDGIGIEHESVAPVDPGLGLGLGLLDALSTLVVQSGHGTTVVMSFACHPAP